MIFDVNNSLSRHTDNRKNDILVLGEETTDGFGYIKIKAEAKYSVNITMSTKQDLFESSLQCSQ